MQPVAAAVPPPCHSQGRLSTGTGAAKSVIGLSRTNNGVADSPWELPCPCGVSRLTQEPAVTGGRDGASSPTDSQPTSMLPLIAQGRLLHEDLLHETR